MHLEQGGTRWDTYGCACGIVGGDVGFGVEDVGRHVRLLLAAGRGGEVRSERDVNVVCGASIESR